MIRAGQRWVRKADGLEVTVEAVGGGSRVWVDLREGSRVWSVSEASLRVKYILKEDVHA